MITTQDEHSTNTQHNTTLRNNITDLVTKQIITTSTSQTTTSALTTTTTVPPAKTTQSSMIISLLKDQGPQAVGVTVASIAYTVLGKFTGCLKKCPHSPFC